MDDRHIRLPYIVSKTGTICATVSATTSMVDTFHTWNAVNPILCGTKNSDINMLILTRGTPVSHGVFITASTPSASRSP